MIKFRAICLKNSIISFSKQDTPLHTHRNTPSRKLTPPIKKIYDITLTVFCARKVKLTKMPPTGVQIAVRLTFKFKQMYTSETVNFFHRTDLIYILIKF